MIEDSIEAILYIHGLPLGDDDAAVDFQELDKKRTELVEQPTFVYRLVDRVGTFAVAVRARLLQR